ncbi:MAG TPA: outer membrane lipoprotein carrier protein LolA [Burkholderiaceae bacterium]
MKFLLTALLLAAAAHAQAAAPVAKIQAMLAKPPVLCGVFEQTKHLAGMKKPLLASGRFCVVAGKGVVWRTLKPFANTLRLTRDEIVHFQGERVAMRLQASQEPTVRVINSVLFSLLSGDLSQLDKLFETDGTADASSWRVSLRAREPALAKAVGAIELDGAAYVKTIELNEASGDRTRIVFSNIKTGKDALQPEEAALLQ